MRANGIEELEQEVALQEKGDWPHVIKSGGMMWVKN
jgi:hypothetical protein